MGDAWLGRVIEIRDGVVQFEPLCRGISYRHATAREIIAHWRKTGAGGRDLPMRQTCRSQPLCRARSCPCASRREEFGRSDPDIAPCNGRQKGPVLGFGYGKVGGRIFCPGSEARLASAQRSVDRAARRCVQLLAVHEKGAPTVRPELL